MSVTILDIMHLPSLQEARIVAGMNGINRSIASVSVLEAAAAKDLDIDLPGHATNYGQEIILTAFVAYRDSVDAQCEAIHALHKEGEAGIIIFYVGSILPSIDPRVIDLANELEMPIIVMPEGRLDLRYSDVICEIMEAIINDRRENSYFTTEVIERISHLGTSQRSINNAVAIIRDRVQCSIYLMDELGRMYPTKRSVNPPGFSVFQRCTSHSGGVPMPSMYNRGWSEPPHTEDHHPDMPETLSKSFQRSAFPAPPIQLQISSLIKISSICAVNVFISPTQRIGSQAFSSSVTPAVSIM